MSDEPEFSVDEIILKWKAECSVPQTAKSGYSYEGIPKENRKELIGDLVQTLIDYGHPISYISSVGVTNKVVLTCWPEYIKSLSNTELKKCRAITRDMWEASVQERDNRIKISKAEKKVFKKPEIPEVVIDLEPPKDRIVMDTSDMVSGDLDLDLLAELGLTVEDVEGKNE